MPELDAVGEAITGGMIGRAVEPQAGEPPGPHKNTRNCLNCGCELTGEFCHCCGQKANVHRTISAWWHDFLHSVLHLDGKFWRTLPMLAWKPGELTRRYAHGERAKFISPLALFLFTVFLMFAVFSLAGPSLGSQLGVSQSVEQGLKEERANLTALEARRAGTAAGSAATQLDKRIAESREDIATLERLRDEGITKATFSGDSEAVQGDAFFQAAYRKAKENPELLIYKLQANGYKFSWALIPISIPFVWIMFLHRRQYRRDFTAYDHLVFVTYSIAFMSLTLVAFVVLATLGVTGGIVGLIFILIPPLHMYRQLRGAYALSRFSAAWRALLLAIFASVALAVFGTLLLLLGVLG
ncbi:MAG: DUF3667 domain-containing protein [Pseudomonadota bacterium]|nr:DUF3667 domain-containing protein [Pseudomonadota bacterium]